MIQRLELSRDAILGRKIAKFVTHDKAFSVDDNAATALMGKLLIFETNYVSASGKTIPAEVYEHRIPWGGVSAVLSISRDITARKNSEVMLTLAYRELELAHNKLLAGRQLERLAFTGRIAASIAHEIRNPSTNASLALSQLCSTSKLEEKQVKYLEIIEKNINRINYLIDEMLNCARPPELNVKPHDIHEILNTVCESVELKMTAMKIKLVKEFTTADAMVNVDREQIGRVFLNLIINAIDAMSRNGGILTIVTETDGESFMIRINDIGKGMSADEIIKIFDPFFTTKTSGIGLGLTTCHGVVVSHGGSIKVTSEVSKGTTFTVTLPEL
jgi:signal transduction histidine kinase